MIKHEIFDLAALRAAELSTVADGAVFLHRDQLCTKFTINGNKAWATLSGHMAPRVAEWRNPSGRIALVRAPVCIRFVPRSEIHHDSVDNPLAHALVLVLELERGIGIGASAIRGQSALSIYRSMKSEPDPVLERMTKINHVDQPRTEEIRGAHARNLSGIECPETHSPGIELSV